MRPKSRDHQITNSRDGLVPPLPVGTGIRPLPQPYTRIPLTARKHPTYISLTSLFCVVFAGGQMTQVSRSLSWIVLVLVCAAPPAFAQGGSSASIVGTVVDTSGAVIPGADVVATNNATGVKFRAVTSERMARSPFLGQSRRHLHRHGVVDGLQDRRSSTTSTVNAGVPVNGAVPSSRSAASRKRSSSTGASEIVQTQVVDGVDDDRRQTR